jgi:hypothetical protein
VSSLALPPAGATPAAEPTPSVPNLRPAAQVRFETDQVSPHNYLYITQSDSLQIICGSQIAGLVVVCDYKILRPDGTITVGEETTVTVALPAVATILVQLTEGFLMNVVVGAASTTVQRGDLFVQGDLVRGRGAALFITQRLFNMYATSHNRAVWPPVSSDAGPTGPGRVLCRSIANPAAGAEFIWTTPPNIRTRLIGVFATFVTSAVVANRLPTLSIDNGANVMYIAPAPAVQVASTGIRYSWGSGVSSVAPVGGNATISLPALMFVPVGGHVRSATNQIDPGDQWSTISFSTEEWIDF